MAKKLKINNFSDDDIDRIIQMAWEDRTTFDVIEKQFGINQDAVIQIMRKNMKRSSFELWRKRTSGRKTKHTSRSQSKLPRFKSSDQK